jgi:DNA-binding NarL/FixJ family response regulator
MPAGTGRRAAAPTGAPAPARERASVFVASDIALYRDSLASLLALSGLLDVVGVGPLRDVAGVGRPPLVDLIVIDASGPALAAAVTALEAGPCVIAVVAEHDDVVCCAAAGVAGLALRSAPGRELLATVLSARELDVLALLERGLSNKEIAAHLSIGTPTVKNHVHRILRKLALRRRGEAAAIARSISRGSGPSSASG